MIPILSVNIISVAILVQLLYEEIVQFIVVKNITCTGHRLFRIHIQSKYEYQKISKQLSNKDINHSINQSFLHLAIRINIPSVTYN
jgi:ribosome recycling factor